MKVTAGTHFDCRCRKCGHGYGFTILQDYEDARDVPVGPCPRCERREREVNAREGVYKRPQPTKEATR